MFKERDWTMKGQVKGPLNKLCLSRQLQQETPRMGLKVNTLYFTGGLLDKDFDIDDDFDPGHSLERAIDDYDFFSKHPITIGLPALRYIRSTALMFKFNGDVFRKLNQVTANCKDSYSPRVYELGWGEGRRILAYKGEMGRDYMSFFRRFDGQYPGRTWRLYPYIWKGEIDKVRKDISAAEFQLALDFINNGI